MSASVLAAAQCLEEGRTRAHHCLSAQWWLTDALTQACWTANPRIAGYALERPVRVSPAIRTRLLAKRKRRASVLETAYRIENWTDGQRETLRSTLTASVHHVLGVCGIGAFATTSAIDGLVQAAGRRADQPNHWLAQAHLLIERRELRPKLRARLLAGLPELISNAAVTKAEALEFLTMEDVSRTGIVEAVAANPHLSDAEAIEVIRSAAPDRGDALTRAGMRRLVERRGDCAALMDEAALMVCRFAVTSFPRTEASIRELIEADAFAEEHYEYIREQLGRADLPVGVMNAWTGANETHIVSTLSRDPSAALFALQNSALASGTQYQVAAVLLRSIDLCPDAVLDRVNSLQTPAAILIAQRAVETGNSRAMAELLRVSRLPEEVVGHVVSSHLHLVQTESKDFPSGLTWFLAENEIPEAVWAELEAKVDSLSDDERTAAASHLMCPDSFSESLLARSTHTGVAFAMAIHPRHEAAIREACIAAIKKVKIPADVCDLLLEHSSVLEAVLPDRT